MSIDQELEEIHELIIATNKISEKIMVLFGRVEKQLTDINAGVRGIVPFGDAGEYRLCAGRPFSDKTFRIYVIENDDINYTPKKLHSCSREIKFKAVAALPRLLEKLGKSAKTSLYDCIESMKEIVNEYDNKNISIS